MNRHVRGCLAVVLLLGLAVGGCGGKQQDGRGQRVAAEARQVAARLAQRPKLVQAVRDTRDALARVGVATKDGKRTYREPVGPAATSYLTPGEVGRLALASRSAQSGQVTLRQLAQMLKEFGWPVPPDRDPAEVVGELMQTWVALARPGTVMAPEDWFAPHFVAEGALRRSGVDLSKDGPIDPDRLRFTTLEIMVFTNSFDQGSTFEPAPTPAGSGPVDPCSDFRRSLGTGGGDFEHFVMNEMRREVVRELMRKAPGGSLGDAFQALRILDRIARLVTLYSAADIAIEVVSANPMHKPLDQAHSAFKATAGLSEEEWEEYRRERSPEEIELETSILDCANQLGLPAPPSLGTLATAVAGWRVEWSAVEGMPRHATINAAESDFDVPGQLQHNLRRIDDHRGETKPLIVDIQPEKKEDHEAGYEESRAPVTVKAQLETSARIQLRTFIDAARGGVGLAAAVAETVAGWLQEMHQPTAYATLTVTYHEPPADYLVTVEGTQVRNWTVDYNDPRLTCDVDVKGNGQETIRFNTVQPLRVKVRPDGLLTHLIAGDESTQFSGLTVNLNARFLRQGKLDLSSDGGCSAGGDGSAGGGTDQNTTDCGERLQYPTPARIEYRREHRQQQLVLVSDQTQLPTGRHAWNPYDSCPYRRIGLVGPPEVVAELPSLDLAKVKPITLSVDKHTEWKGDRNDVVRTHTTWKIVFTPARRK